MNIYIMTDMEGVAGVLSSPDWCHPEGRYYERGKELLTLEVNAAIEGFCAAGAAGIAVADGHGWGGIDPVLLDPRAELMRGFPGPYPFLLDAAFDAAAWVGQHAKAGAEFAHLAHTNSMRCLDQMINGVSVGEFGELVLCAGELGVRTVFLAGDQAACDEAREFVPGIETAAVKRGVLAGAGEACGPDEYRRRNEGAVHKHPETARALIRDGAERALRRAVAETFGIVELVPPFERVLVMRADSGGPGRVGRGEHPTSVIELMNQPLEWEC